jgi:hypothetical protein
MNKVIKQKMITYKLFKISKNKQAIKNKLKSKNHFFLQEEKRISKIEKK